jgi:hypothetical protein
MRPVGRADNIHEPIVLKSGNPDLLETLGRVRACTEIALPLHSCLNTVILKFRNILNFQAKIQDFCTLLTVHIGTILVYNQLDTQFFFLICLLQFSTYFEQHRAAHHQEN